MTFEDSGLGLDYPDALKSSLVIVDTDQIEFENFKLNLDDFRCLVEENEAIGLIAYEMGLHKWLLLSQFAEEKKTRTNLK